MSVSFTFNRPRIIVNCQGGRIFWLCQLWSTHTKNCSTGSMRQEGKVSLSTEERKILLFLLAPAVTSDTWGAKTSVNVDCCFCLVPSLLLTTQDGQCWPSAPQTSYYTVPNVRHPSSIHLSESSNLSPPIYVFPSGPANYFVRAPAPLPTIDHPTTAKINRYNRHDTGRFFSYLRSIIPESNIIW